MAQAAFAFEDLHLDSPSADPADPDGFQIGWDHAHHGVTPPAEHLLPGHPVRQGWAAGRATFGQRTLRDTVWVRRWLALRLQAWSRGLAFEGWVVNPRFMKDIDVTHCPVTRVRLGASAQERLSAVVDRVYRGAGYAAGNLATLSEQARAARDAAPGWREAALRAQRCEAERLPRLGPLNGAQWARLSTLLSLATPLPHAEAAAIPLRVLPPNRLRVINPVQALQVVLTLQFLQPGYSARIETLQGLMPDEATGRALRALMVALMVRRVAAGRVANVQAVRRVLEDAWATPGVQMAWRGLAARLTRADCEQVVARAESLGLQGTAWRALSEAAATDGWALADGGQRRPAPAPRPAVGRGTEVAWDWACHTPTDPHRPEPLMQRAPQALSSRH